MSARSRPGAAPRRIADQVGGTKASPEAPPSILPELPEVLEMRVFGVNNPIAGETLTIDSGIFCLLQQLSQAGAMRGGYRAHHAPTGGSAP